MPHLRHSTFTPVGQLRLPCALRTSPIGKKAFGSLELTSICKIVVQIGRTEARLRDPRNAARHFASRTLLIYFSYPLSQRTLLPFSPHSRLKACYLPTKLLLSTARKRQKGLLAISTCHIRFIMVWLGTSQKGISSLRQGRFSGGFP